MLKIEEYLNFCNNKSLINKKIFKKRKNPKISIITPVYNKESTINRYLNSIQNQAFDDLEIIIIDDKSTDNSIKIIEEAEKVDKRIILIKNEKRKGTLISKNIGVFQSIGKYLLFVDPDDIISENIINSLFILAKENNFDLIRFKIYRGKGSLNIPWISYYLKSKIIYKSDIYYYLFYGFGKLFQLDFYITNKLIKRNLFIIALNSINKYYLYQFMIDCEDGLINFMLHKLSKSYFYIDKIGYYYILTNQSITSKASNFKKRLKSNFLYLKYLYENTKNNNIEKKMSEFVFLDIISNHPNIINIFQKLSYDSKFYLNIINKYIKSEFISLKAKQIMRAIKKAIMRKKRFFKNHKKLKK